MPDHRVPAVMTVPSFLGEGRITFTEKEVPTPGAGQLLLKVTANALCGSERGQFYRGTSVTPGHEGAGVVIAAGEDTRTTIGTPGVVYLMDYCGECRSCRQGLTNQCLHKRGDMGFNRDGGYGAYELVPESIFFPVDPEIPPAEATLLLDIMGTNGHAIGRAKLVHPDPQSMVVAGAGPIGLGMLAMAKIRFGPDFPVVIFDLSEWRLDLAEKLGGLPVDLNRHSLPGGLQHHGLAEVDLAMDTSGKGEARQACMAALAKRGVLVCIGHGQGLTLDVSPDLIATERAVMGSEYFRYSELAENLVLLRQRRAELRPIITHRFGVEDIQAAFELFFQGQTGKVIVEQ